MDCHELLTIAKREIAKSSAGIVEVNWELSAAIILYQLAKDETGRKTSLMLKFYQVFLVKNSQNLNH
jgi:hypothetical protein